MKKMIVGFAFCLFLFANAKAQTAPQYKSDSIIYHNDTISIGATISYPLTKGNHIAVILLSGTGRQDRDGTMAGHKMFKAIADSLVKQGIVVLRSDDRGVGVSGGNYEKATTEDFANDAIAAVNYLRTRKDLHINKIGLVGHSEGGMAAAIAASKSSQINFVISLSSPGERGLEALLLQNKTLVHAAPIPEINKLRFDSINNLLFHVVYNNVGSPDLETKMRKAYADWKVWDDSLVKANNLEFGGHFFFPLESFIRQATGAWYQYFITYDPAKVLPKVKVPYFAINGDKDVISEGSTNLKGIADNLTKGGNKQVKTWLVPGLNHLYQRCTKCTTDEYATLKEDFDPAVSAAMATWINALK